LILAEAMKRAAGSSGRRRGGPAGVRGPCRPLFYGGVELRCTRRFEDQAAAEGFVAVAGVDEVGRGALCGPVLACAVVLDDGFDVGGIDDSKRLTARRREALAERIRETSRAWAVGLAEPREIDRLNILRATHLAMRRAVAGLAVAPDLVLVDGFTVGGLRVEQRAIVKGDAQSVSIAAASIVAKVMRDAMMRESDERYPGYGLARNMGYGSRDHLAALRDLGPCEIHRQTFQGAERWLF
jgi:ribonuclease HII